MSSKGFFSGGGGTSADGWGGGISQRQAASSVAPVERSSGALPVLPAHPTSEELAAYREWLFARPQKWVEEVGVFGGGRGQE